MSLHADELVPEFQGRVVRQRIEDDFLWGLLQHDSPHIHAWVGGAVNMVLADVGDLIEPEQQAAWRARLLDTSHPDLTVAHAFLAFALWQYPQLFEALEAEGHHFPRAQAFFVHQVLPSLFEDFFDNRHNRHTLECFVRDFRAEYVFTVGFTLRGREDEGGGENIPPGART
jgi:hypothetical protein